MHTTYTLQFRALRVGTILQQDFDFPRLFGTYTLELSDDGSALTRHILDYVAYSIEAWRLAMLDDDDGSEWDQYQAKHEMQFIDLIECDDWYLVSDGKKQRILIPNFGTDEEVVWTWDFSNKRRRSPSQDPE